MISGPIQFDTGPITATFSTLFAASSRSSEFYAEFSALLDDPASLFLLVEQEPTDARGLTVRIEPTEILSRLVSKARRIAECSEAIDD